jgi:hypothetical protein
LVEEPLRKEVKNGDDATVHQQRILKIQQIIQLPATFSKLASRASNPPKALKIAIKKFTENGNKNFTAKKFLKELELSKKNGKAASGGHTGAPKMAVTAESNQTHLRPNPFEAYVYQVAQKAKIEPKVVKEMLVGYQQIICEALEAVQIK